MTRKERVGGISAAEENLFPKGSLVMSLAGRDAGRILIVADDHAEGRADCVCIADGKLRRMEKTKVKKMRHLRRLPLPIVDVPQSNRQAADLICGAEKALQLIRAGEGADNQPSC